MRSAISRLRALVHGVLLCSLLTTWLGKPVDVVASFGTRMTLVCSYPRDGASCQSDCGGSPAGGGSAGEHTILPLTINLSSQTAAHLKMPAYAHVMRCMA